MLTVRFDVSDLARTRFAISPMDHVLMAVATGHDCVGARQARWWRRVRRLVPHRAAPLIELVGASTSGLPAFLVPSRNAARPRLADELDHLHATAAAALRRAPADHGPQHHASRPSHASRTAQRLRDGDTGELRRVLEAAHALFQACLAPDWPAFRWHLAADIADRTHAASEAGFGTVLDALHSHAEWHEDGALRCSTKGEDQTVALGGTGLELRPNYFVQGSAGVLVTQEGSSVLLHPTLLQPTAGPEDATDQLSLLLGPARARVLRILGQQPCSTSQIAARLGISASTASAHATALRMGGAIVTRRRGREVQHCPAPLGRVLLRGDQGEA